MGSPGMIKGGLDNRKEKSTGGGGSALKRISGRLRQKVIKGFGNFKFWEEGRNLLRGGGPFSTEGIFKG